MNWLSRLGLDDWVARGRIAAIEAAVAAQDRAELARLEWALHKRHLAWLGLLGLVFGALVVVVALLLSAAVLVQFWDTPQRVQVAWLLACAGALACAVVLYALVALARHVGNAFALTRKELASDWQAIKEQL